MPKCHKTYPNCFWHVPPEWYGLNSNSAVLTKIYWDYANHTVRVCASSKIPINPNLAFTKKSNLQVKFGSEAMASLYELLWFIFSHLRIYSSTNYSPISLHVFTLKSSLTLPTNTPRMMNQSILSTHQFLHFIPMIQPTFLKYFYIFLIFSATPKFLPQLTGTKHTKRPSAENNRRPGRGSEDPTKPKNRRHWRAAPAAPAFPGQSRRGTVAATADS